MTTQYVANFVLIVGGISVSASTTGGKSANKEQDETQAK